ncbi:MAG: hypothetical protein ACI4RN_08435 [Oscillospiraceae bacterium]
MTMYKCSKCYHKKVCIDGANYRFAEKCKNYVPEKDVQEVKHGRWVKEKKDALISWHCSVCEKCYYLDEPKDAFYCPHCGARMDGDEND